MGFRTLLWDGIRGRSWYSTLIAYSFFLLVFVPIGFCIHYHYHNEIESIAPRYGKNGQAVEFHYLVTLLKPVTNEEGTLEVWPRDGHKISLAVEPLLVLPYKPEIKNQDQVPGLARGKPTKQLYLDYPGKLDTSLLQGAWVVFREKK